MFIEQINGQNIKIKFDINEKQPLLGDILKITTTGKTGVLVQIAGISTDSKNSSYNVADSKILFTIEESGKLTKWQGNLPSQDFMIARLSADEVLLCSNTSNPQNPVPVGDLSLYPGVALSLEASFFEKPTVIYCDKQTQKENILYLLACEISKTAGKTVLIDFNNDFSDLKVASILEAGKNIKLPLDLKTLELLYNKTLSDVSAETRAVIEDIFMEIENYLSSGEVEFIPFNAFRDAVESVYETNKITELVLLKNKLSRLDKQGIFAARENEITILNDNIKKNNLVIVDLSKFSHEWQKDLIDSIIDSNNQKYKQKFFLIVDIDKINADKAFIEKLCSKANKNGIYPVIVSGHESENTVSLLAYAANIIAFAPENTTKLTTLKDNFVRLKDNEAVITGKLTNYIPLYVNIYDEESDGISLSIENSVLLDQKIYLSPQNDSVEAVTDNFNYSNQFEHEESGIELISDISNLQEEVYVSPEETEESPQQEEISEEDLELYLSEDYSEEEYVDEEIEETSTEDYIDEEAEEYDEDADEEEYDPDMNEEDEIQNINSAKTGFYDEFEQEESYENSEEYGTYDKQSSLYEEEDEETDEQEEYEQNSYSANSAGSFYDEYDSETNESAYRNPSQKYDSGFSEDDLASFIDVDDDDEYSQNSYAQDEEDQGDENFDYNTNDEFQDESVLDYSDFYDDDSSQDISYNNEYNYEESDSEEEYDNDAYEEPEQPQVKHPKQGKQLKQTKAKPSGPPTPDIPIYSTPKNEETEAYSEIDFQEGDKVRHSKYGMGVVNKIIGSNEKRLCSIQFDDVGRRLLDPKMAELQKIS